MNSGFKMGGNKSLNRKEHLKKGGGMNVVWSFVFLLVFVPLAHAGMFDDALKSGLGAAVQTVTDQAVSKQDAPAKQGTEGQTEQKVAQQQAEQPSAAQTEVAPSVVEKKNPWTDADTAALVKTFKTNFSADELKVLLSSKLHLIAIQSDDREFLQTLIYFGFNQLTLEQRKLVFGSNIVDSGNNWLSRITSLEKIGSDTVCLKFDFMGREDPVEPLKPFRKEFYFRWHPATKSLMLIQLRAYGTQQGDVKINNDESNGFMSEQAYVVFIQAIAGFAQTGTI